MSSETKLCPQCAEEIKAAAKKCKHCHSLLANPSWVIARATWPLLILLAVPLYTFYSLRSSTKYEDFGKHRTEVTIANSQMTFTQNPDGNYVSVIGTIKNTGDQTWSPVSFEVQYFNQAGHMIDALTDRSYDVTLTPHSEQAFHLKNPANKSGSEYASHKVIVRDADDAMRFRR
jgi:hypothetical protein